MLSFPAVYDVVQRMLGANRGRAIIASDYIRAFEGARVLDIGCGTAEILDVLPPVRYVGFDESKSYIAAARKRFGSSATFVEGSLSQLANQAVGKFDLVLAIGVLHHLNDSEALSLFAFAREHITPSGRLVTVDGCYVASQSPLARFLLSRDRGRFVRKVDEYLSLARTSFSNVRPAVRHDLSRFPYTHLIMECSV